MVRKSTHCCTIWLAQCRATALVAGDDLAPCHTYTDALFRSVSTFFRSNNTYDVLDRSWFMLHGTSRRKPSSGCSPLVQYNLNWPVIWNVAIIKSLQNIYKQADQNTITHFKPHIYTRDPRPPIMALSAMGIALDVFRFLRPHWQEQPHWHQAGRKIMQCVHDLCPHAAFYVCWLHTQTTVDTDGDKGTSQTVLILIRIKTWRPQFEPKLG